MTRRKISSSAAYSMYSSLHAEVSPLLKEGGLHFDFHNIDEPSASTREYDTNIMGKFKCANDACSSSGWSSNKISVTIRLYSGNRYNARVYHQRCKRCKSLSRPLLDETYAERVTYRLKKWSGVEVERPSHSGGKSKGPHQSSLCEGCKAGHCSEQD